MNDTARRFLGAVLERVAEERIVEVRLFPAIRQGGIETGVAVLAVELEPEPAAAPVASLEAGAVAGEAGVSDLAAPSNLPLESEVLVQVGEPADGSEPESEGEAIDLHSAEPRVTSVASGPGSMDEDDVAHALKAAFDRESALEVVAEGVSASAPRATSVDREISLDLVAAALPADARGPEDEESVGLGDILALPSPEGANAPGSPAPRHRLSILCARYRLVLKGPDRGKWEVEIMHQADAPLATLDRVISGVVRRSGEESEPERYTRERLRESLDAPVWAQGA